MDKPALSDTLHGLAQAKTARSETARLRDVITDVEHALDRGVSRKAVLEALHADGFTMSLKMFDKALYRIRKRIREEGSRSSSVAGSTARALKAPATTSHVSRNEMQKISKQFDEMDLDAMVSAKASSPK